jgi:F420-0:gamma-glutamyl ligase-like protein
MNPRDFHFHLDLDLVAESFRDELQRFAEEGVPPNDRTLLAVVLGQYRYAIKAIGDGPNTLAGVIHFLEGHLPDFAWGSPQAVARWEHMKKYAAALVALAGGGMGMHYLCRHHHEMTAHLHHIPWC